MIKKSLLPARDLPTDAPAPAAVVSTMSDTARELVNSSPVETPQLGLGIELHANAAGDECTTLLGTRFLESREADSIALEGHPHLRHEPA